MFPWRAFDTVVWALGGDSWETVAPMIERIMRKHRTLGVGFKCRDGAFMRFRIDLD